MRLTRLSALSRYAERDVDYPVVQGLVCEAKRAGSLVAQHDHSHRMLNHRWNVGHDCDVQACAVTRD